MPLFPRLFRKPPPDLPAGGNSALQTFPVSEFAQERMKAAIESEEESLRGAIASGGDAELVARLAIEGSSSRIRQLAAEAVQDPVTIKRLIRDIRGKDKNVYKILKRKNDALLAAEREVEQTQAAIEAR